MSTRAKAPPIVLLVVASAARGEPARATLLLRLDAESSIEQRIDRADLEAGAALDRSLEGMPFLHRFSTRDLEEVATELASAVRLERPPCAAKLVTFLHPGRVSYYRLRQLEDVVVDIDIVLGQCDERSRERAVGTHVELVGRVLKSPSYAFDGYSVTFRHAVIRATTELGERVYHVPAEDCVTSAWRGGGEAWLQARRLAAMRFEALLSSSTEKAARKRHLRLLGAPHVRRVDERAEVVLTVESHTARAQEDVLLAMTAASVALQNSHGAPVDADIEVRLNLGSDSPERRFRAPAYSVALWKIGRIGRDALLATYVREIHGDAPVLDFTNDR